ncbi:MAG: glycosyltransferase [Myxococcota bacterium]|nr:glycosyltransferase [Myxococcota bacterium]
MAVSPCLLIPVFEHGREIAGVLEGLAAHGLPCLVVDDGSGETTRKALEELAARYPWVSVQRRPDNGGRGAALKTGYRWAFRRGFTHAIQLDADGQHDTGAVPRFVEAVQKQPDALVLGAPVFDASIPRGRLYGRQLSRAMVWGLTGSFRVEDPLCGFRGIPLAETIAFLDSVATGDHMEFDPELVIGLAWRGAPILNVPTRVVYDPDGVSHFDMLRDNARLSWVYTRSVFSLPLRLAQALVRRREAAAVHATPRPGNPARSARAGTTSPAALPEIASLVPHAGPMCLLSHVVEHTAERTVCAVDPEGSELFRTSAGLVPAWVGLEYMAQGIAAHAGLIARLRGEAPRPGLFLGSRRTDIAVDAFRRDQRLEVTCRHLQGEGKLAWFACSIEDAADGKTLAQGRLSVYAMDGFGHPPGAADGP